MRHACRVHLVGNRQSDGHLMDILFLLIPVSVLLALAVMAVLGWAVWAGQFEDIEVEGRRILDD